MYEPTGFATVTNQPTCSNFQQISCKASPHYLHWQTLGGVTMWKEGESGNKVTVPYTPFFLFHGCQLLWPMSSPTHTLAYSFTGSSDICCHPVYMYMEVHVQVQEGSGYKL
jgi:hypothetical protein